ncbi:DNA excision repair protein ERCC-6 [Eumeta japonica]|uniref:DNA repair and recombination protein RAD54-like n=1 Tax=Eumeta variegata TaxID=151549 RepID=A0A4C1YQI6_EUMVA|nr:DNA excision repair protein ERCC-6 [Eumeta japonica]
MIDINKYLEEQLALSKQKQLIKATDTKNTVSSKSKSVAELISKKQCKTSIEKTEIYKEQSTSGVCSDNESEYLPSCSEGEDDNLPLTICEQRRIKQNLNKIIDDGDSKTYNRRILMWKRCLQKACCGETDLDTVSADIQYVILGYKNHDEIHELQNGFCIPIYIWKQLYKYQRIGVQWLWELHQIKSGGLLGDEMGLGKTVQVIAFLAGLSKTHLGTWGGLGPSIIVAPATVIYQWVEHFHYWCPYLRVAVLHHTGSHVGTHFKLIKDIYAAHGILLVTYAGIIKYIKDILGRTWHYIILDEGHKIRNPETQVSKLIRKIKTPHRLIITGSPMQNSLQELWSLFDFMSPGLLGSHNAFMEHFATPITQGGYANATELQETTALEIAKTLKSIIMPYMLRRTKSEVQEHIHLPEKNEQVLFCSLTSEQRDLYIGYLMSMTVRSILDKENKYNDPLRAKILIALTTLRKICNHPDLYLYEVFDELEAVEDNFGYWKRSGKMSVVHSLLKIWQKQGHRALIFTQSRAMLCLLEQYLQKQKYKYLRMDGTVSVSQRQNIIKTFNEDGNYLVFLATTKVGGLGVNLTGANRVIIYDPDWNPATDTQAKERAWRIGQHRNVTVYRLLSAGTIEEKIYQRQVFKQLLTNKVLIDPNQKNFLTTSTLQGLFSLEEPNNGGDTETASLFKHTKIVLKQGHKTINNDIKTEKKIFSKTKLAEMKQRAKEISNKLSSNAVNSKLQEDPRERYKRQRDLLLNPPKVEETQINLLDDKETNIPFEYALSEIDIINQHVKKDYEQNLINDVIKNQTEIESVASTSNNELLSNGPINDNENQNDKNDEINESIKVEIDKQTEPTLEQNRKRKHVPIIDYQIEKLVTVKKVKKRYKDKSNLNDDDYVLNKLFAKATVKNALEHDKVIGLAEKEKRHKMKEEACKKAKRALKAIRRSCI